MTSKYLAMAACAAALSLAGGSAALAQAAAAPAAAAAAVTQGPPIAGLCVISSEGVLATSSVGRAVATRLQQIASQATAELQAEQTSIDNDARALDAARTTLDQTTLEQRAAALQVRANAFQRKQQLRQRELEATRDKQITRVGQEMDPLIAQASRAKNCSVLIASEAVLSVNPAMDLTPAVVTALNGKLTTLTFDRERLDQQAAAAPPVTQTPAARPAAAPAAAAPARR